MRARDIVIGLIFFVILILGTWWIIKNRDTKPGLSIPLKTPTITDKVQQAFPGLTVPEGVDRADLDKVEGGPEGVGLATRQKTLTGYNFTVIANLPDSTKGGYTAELTDGNSVIVMGKLSVSKSGYLVNYSVASDVSKFLRVRVIEGGTTVLEGSF